MSTPARNLVFGTALAALFAVVMLVPSIGGVSTWKWILAAGGLALFVLAGRRPARR
jgi:hypothetical protein